MLILSYHETNCLGVFLLQPPCFYFETPLSLSMEIVLNRIYLNHYETEEQVWVQVKRCLD